MRKNEINGMFDFCLSTKCGLKRRKLAYENEECSSTLALNNFRVKHGILMYLSDVESEHILTV